MRLSDLHRRVSVEGLFFAQKYSQNLAFCYSTYKLSQSANKTIRARNLTTLQEEDIGFVANNIDVTSINNLSSGVDRVGSRLFYNQGGTYNADLVSTDNVNLPFNNSTTFQAFDFLEFFPQGSRSFWNTSIIGTPPIMNGDYIISYVSKNERLEFNSRPNIYLKQDANNNFTAMIFINSGFLNVSFIFDKELTGTYDFYYQLPTSANSSWGIYTFSRIQGVFKAYHNGIEKTLLPFNSFLPLAPDSRGNAGVGLNARPIALGGNRSNEVKSYILHTGNDLSSFPIDNYLDDLKLIHGIS